MITGELLELSVTMQRRRGAQLLAAEPSALQVLMAEDIVHAQVSHDIIGCPAGDPFGGFTPVDDSAIRVADVQAVIERVQDHAGDHEIRCRHRNPVVKHLGYES